MKIKVKLFFYSCIALVLCAFSPCTSKEYHYKYNLAVCTIFQNEARFLKEWIEFHKLAGVEHFYLYNNNSSDNYLEVLDPYIKTGDVELVHWSNDKKGWNETQQNAYKDAIKKCKNTVRWLVMIDCDEFVFPVLGDNISDFLKNYEQYPALVVNWQCFGTSHVYRIPDDKLMIEMLVNKADPDHYDNRYVKSIINPKSTITGKSQVHHFYYHHNKSAVNADYVEVKNFRSPYVCVDKIRINHYRTRDEEHFINVKLPRLKKWYEDNAARCFFEDHNQVFDDAILRFVPALKKKIFP